MVPNRLTANATQTTAMAMSIGHSSSAYSLLVVKPSGSVIAARDDDRLPAPEIEPAQEIAEHPRLAQPLQRIVDAHEHAVADEGEDHRVRVQRAEAAEGDELEVQVRAGKNNCTAASRPADHADDAPDDRRDGKRAHDPVVIFEGLHLRAGAAPGLRWLFELSGLTLRS